MKKNEIFRILTHHTLRVRHFNNSCIKHFAKDKKNKKILELGSGKKHKGKDYYSAKQYFDSSNEFIQSDIKKDYGHKIVDITKLDEKEEYDIIICMNVLEHVYDFNKAVKNILNALKPEGTAIIFVPVFYPLHDEPHDYWRFTEHSLRKILSDFSETRIRHKGIRQYPFAYYIEAKK